MKKPDKKNILDILALTPMQEGILFHYLSAPQGQHYVEQLSLSISGEIDFNAFTEAWNVVIETNEMLRAVFWWEQIINPVQFILKENKLHPGYFDLSAGDVDEKKRQLEEIKVRDREKKFDLRNVPFRVILCKLEEAKYEMIISNHHILYDGWSNGIILKEFFGAYNDFVKKKKAEIVRKTAFKEFVKSLHSQDLNKLEKYWRAYLMGFDTQTDLPVKRKKTNESTGTGNYRFKLAMDMKEELESFVKKHKITLAALFYTAWGILLQKYNDTDDVIFGTTVSGRSVNIKGIEHIVGLFINTLPLRIKTNSNEKTRELLVQIDNVLQERKEYEAVSLVNVKQFSEIDSKEELFDNIVVIENYPLDSSLIPENSKLSLSADSFSMVEMTHYDLTVIISMVNDLDVTFGYKKELFGEETIVRLSNHFRNIVIEILGNPDREILGLEIISVEEKEKILAGFNNTGVDFPGDKTIQRLFSEQAGRAPNHISLSGQKLQITKHKAPVYKEGRGQNKYKSQITNERRKGMPGENSGILDEVQLSYKELNDKSNQLAYYLVKKGVKADMIVGIMVERSIEMIIGILGILKSGGAYLPIDPNYPGERIRLMLKDSKTILLLTTHPLAEKVKNLIPLNVEKNYEFICIDSFEFQFPSPQLLAFPSSQSHNLAYVIYTSGSTGVPRGVMIRHRSVVNRLHWMQRAYPLHAGDVILQKTPVTFDVSVWELFWWSFYGAGLCLLGPGKEKDPGAIINAVARNRVTVMHFVPSMLNVFLDYLDNSAAVKVSKPLASLRQVFSSGEALKVNQVKQFTRLLMEPNGTRLTNLYGPTEATVDVSYYDCVGVGNPERIPIGKPIDNICLYVLDRAYHHQPIGVPGQLYISGIGLTSGYLNNPETTSEKFCLRRHNIYKTGDLARWLEDGNIEFIGRMDHQVKIRGYRIELGEIENRLARYQDIKDVVLTVLTDKNDDSDLCAYIVSTGKLSLAELRVRLAGELPDYMVPAYFVFMDEIPLTHGGKVNRKALPEPEPGDEETEKELFVDNVEQGLIKLFREILGPVRVGRDADFFQLGGHSLKAILLSAKISREFNIEFSINTLFNISSIKGIASFIRKSGKCFYQDMAIVEKREYYPLSSAQKRLFFLDHFEYIGTSYNMPFIVKITGKIDSGRFEESFLELIRRHETLRTSFDFFGSTPVQRIHDAEAVKFKIQEISVNNRDGDINDIIDDFVRPFDLKNAPLLRAALCRLSQNECLLFFDMHHIISDGTSTGILVSDFMQSYHGERLSRLKVHYRDFSAWQHNLDQTGVIKSQEEYWLDIFHHDIPKLNLPADFPRPGNFTFAGDRFKFELGDREILKLKEICVEKNVTLFMSLLAVFNILLYKYTGEEDIIVGTAAAGRVHPDVQQNIGMFVNMLALRNQPRGEKSYAEFLDEVKEVSIKAFENQDLQFEALVDRLNVVRDASRNPIFDVCLVIQNFERKSIRLEGLTFSPYDYVDKISQFDLSLEVWEVEDDVMFHLEYYSGLFERKTIEGFSQHLLIIIEQICQNPGILVSDIEIIREDERRLIIDRFNKSEPIYQSVDVVHELFFQQAQKTPHTIAVVYNDGYLTYSELDKRADCIANYLYAERDVLPDVGVGIMIDRSGSYIEAVLGVLKAGSAYVPIDPLLPAERIKAILNDARVGVVISEKKYIRKLNRLQWECRNFKAFLCIDSWNFHREKAVSEDEWQNMQQLWNYIGETTNDEITAGGWVSSYTGEPFSREEMDEYGDNILVKLTPLLQKKMNVLEIGCASGISMYRLAPEIGCYYGTDLSAAIIHKNNEKIRKQGIKNIRLVSLPAHEIDKIPWKDIDLVIMNSVIQDFFDINYLRNVIFKVVNLMGESGYIFIGDVMDQDLKDDLIREMKEFKRENQEKKYKTKTDFSEELFVSRAFFKDLALEIPAVCQVEFSNKIFTIENELTKFRYDTLIEVNKVLTGKKSTGSKGKKKHKYQDDLRILSKYLYKKGKVKPGVKGVKPANLAYIMYTSGSTGRPKGVMVEHGNIIAYLHAFYHEFSVSSTDTVLQQASSSFDVFTEEVYPVLLRGGRLVIARTYDILDMDGLTALIKKNRISIISCSPLLLRELNKIPLRICLRSIHTFISGGDLLRKEYVDRLLGVGSVYNSYGPTETTVCVTYYQCPADVSPNIPIGRPILNNRVYILDKNNRLLPLGVPGQLCISGESVTRGYLNEPELTAEKFERESWRNNFSFFNTGLKSISKRSVPEGRRQKMYKTGDLARWLPGGNIEFLGRIDNQVKIRGFRIEPQEIENKLKTIDFIKDAVVIVKEDSPDEKFLCAYFEAGDTIDIPGLKVFLSEHLPGYMIPSYFMQLEQIPRTSSGKIDRLRLPAPGIIFNNENYMAPRDDVERKLVNIWADVLDINDERQSGAKSLVRIGIDDNFFELGGHSLRATILVSQVHRVFQVKIPLAEVFKTPIIRELAAYIKEAAAEKHADIRPKEQRDYYPLSSAQKRLFFLQQMDLNSTVYNMPQVLSIDESMNEDYIGFLIKRLISRHESLRTYFERVNGEPMQRICREKEFVIEEVSLPTGSPLTVDSVIKDFIRPFDLTQGPLLRMGFIGLPQGNHLWITDMHHIIADGTSGTVLIEDFMSFYKREEPAPLRLQYKDFSQWQNRLFASGEIKSQEKYWIGLLAGEIPRLELPYDYKRPEVFTFAGDSYDFVLDSEEASKFRAMVTCRGGTLYMNILAVLNTLFFKYTYQQDIIIGTGIAGRHHADLRHIIGMFVNTLAMRNHPQGNKSYEFFLAEVIDNSVKAFENQDLQFEELVDRLDLVRNPARNPLFDISMVVQNFRQPGKSQSGTGWQAHELIKVLPLAPQELSLIQYKNPTAKFDMTFFVREIEDRIHINLEYYTGVFKPDFIHRLALHFKNIVNAVIKEPCTRLKDIEIISLREKQQLIFEFNATASDFPWDKTIHRLFEEQVEKKPDHTALVVTNDSIFITYQDLNERSNQLANYLYYERHHQADEPFGILMSSPMHRSIAIIGILKSGCAYVPLSPSLPQERLKYIINDACICTVISEKKHIKILNQLQWECRSFHGYLVIDSPDIDEEKELEHNELMNRELWHHVGKSAVDDITGGGWISSYTGEPFSRQEMEEYGENILRKLSPLLHGQMRVLEIGTASGITMFHLAPRVGFYYATDLSEVIIKEVKARVEREGHKNIKLSCLAAHEILQIKERNFDLIIMNSVIQCFHGHQYLGQVLRMCIELLSCTGYLFIGDIMDLDKKKDLLQDLVAFKNANQGRGYAAKTDVSAELFIAREFWEDLAAELMEIEDIRFSDKIYTIENELTRFRYDTLIYVNKKRKQAGENRFPGRWKKHKIRDDSRQLSGFGKEKVSPQVTISSRDIAYIIYTSGSTGMGKGVHVEHRGVVNTLWYRKSEYNMNPGDVCLQLFSYAFDGFVTSFFTPLVSGCKLVMLCPGNYGDIEAVREAVLKEKVTHFICIPHLFKILLDTTAGEEFSSLKTVTLAGDKPGKELLTQVRERHKNLEIVNEYGVTEASVMSTIYRRQQQDDSVKIGHPIWNTCIFILDAGERLQPRGVPGELCISGIGLARGYLNRPELTSEKFCLRRPGALFIKTAPGPCKNFLLMTNQTLLRGVQGGGFLEKSPPGRRRQKIYKTGDLARWLLDKNIEFLGRIDFQVKIRGFRIELSEIENRLTEHDAITGAIVSLYQGADGDKYLCAYFQVNPVIPGIKADELREFLVHKLPDYMIPSYFVPVDRIPLTPGGKPDRKQLITPTTTGKKEYSPPGNKLETQLQAIWSEVLPVPKETLGVDRNFFAMGGHSLKATVLASKIHKELYIKVPLAEVFKHQTIRGLAGYIKKTGKNKYNSIEPVEKKEYYALSSAQKRMYFLQQLDLNSTAYNIPLFLHLENDVDKEKLEITLKQLIVRHESLRTSFHMLDETPVQRIFHEVDFKIESKTAVIYSFIRPFDLSEAPLLRSGLIKLADKNYLWIIDIHHIISDGTSHTILTGDFTALYQEEELEPLRLHYKDFSFWQGHMFDRGAIKNQENYWLELYSGEIPRLQLPTDDKRPGVFSFVGDTFDFSLETEDARKFKNLALECGGTLYMNILAILNTLFYKITGQTDIIIGSGIAGRPHVDLQQIIGMFVNTLAIRNFPNGEKSYEYFLKEVISSSINAFENQDVQFEDLVDKLALTRDPSRNPLFDVTMVVQNFRQIEGGNEIFSNSGQSQYDYFNKTTKFDMTFFIREQGEDIHINIEYYTAIFKTDTIRRLVLYFKNVIKAVVENPSIKLNDIDIISGQDRRQILYEFNRTSNPYPMDKTINELFEEQVEKLPDKIAIIGAGTRFIVSNPETCTLHMTYKQINELANQLANYLYNEKCIQSQEPVGIFMSRSIDMVLSILGISKAGAAYVPLDPVLPEERIKYIIDDTCTGTVIAEKRHIRTLNRLQWECKCFHSFLCLDTEDIYKEKEVEQSGHMNQELWHHIGREAVDDITAGGWTGSFTGEPFSRVEMDEYGDNALKKLESLLHPRARVLEIGTASGITMFRIAPKVKLFYGTDLSEVIIEKNREIVKEKAYKNIKLTALPAHEINRLDENRFDIIIINSVIQAFPGHNYLRRVIKQCIDLLGDRGYLFIGDIMDPEKKDELVRELLAFKYAECNRSKNYSTKTDFSAELFVSRGFWEDLGTVWPEIRDIRFSSKIYKIENELTRFRYDTMITINKQYPDRTVKKRQKRKHQDDLRILCTFKGESFSGQAKQCPTNLAYIMYTSGSTGRPKGVMIEHRNVVRLVKNPNFIDFSVGDRLLLTGRIAFDISTFETWLPLLNSFALYLAAEEVILEADKLAEFIAAHRISILHLIPQLFNQLSMQRIDIFSGLRYFLVGGDLVQPVFVNRLRSYNPDIKILHMYGPTENTTFSTFHPVNRTYDSTIPIGKSVSNSIAYILNNSGQLQPPGIPGELCVGGDGVSRGYLNNPETTSNNFTNCRFQNTNKKFLRGSGGRFFQKEPPGRRRQKIYKTGDWARWLVDGTIEFLGRIDTQVKIRGIRIELEEIQMRLQRHHFVEDAVVIDRQDRDGEKYLCAYVVGPESLDIYEIKEYLTKYLADYMIPGYISRIDKIPVTQTGKVDRSALPGLGIVKNKDYTAPRDEREEKLAVLWSEILGIEKSRISIYDDFFRVGGHSLRATRMVTGIKEIFGVKVPLAEIFKTPAICDLGRIIQESSNERYVSVPAVEKREYYPLSYMQKRLFILNEIKGIGTAYNIMSALLVTGMLDRQRLERAFRRLIRRHETLRTSFQIIDNEPVQQVHDEVEFDIEDAAPSVDFSLIIKNFVRPFDFNHAPLVRVGLSGLGRHKFLLLFDIHHIVSDGTSMKQLVQDVLAYYQDEKIDVPLLRIQYKDFSLWQTNRPAKKALEKSGQYWLERFKAKLPESDIFTDFPRPPVQSFAGDSLLLIVDKALTVQVRQIMKETRTTLYMVLLAVFNILLCKYSGEEDVIVGTPIAGREHSDFHPLIGLFINVLAMRNFPAREKTFAVFLQEVKENTLAAYENQDYPFDLLLEKVAMKRDIRRNALYDVELGVQNMDTAELEIQGIKFSPYEFDRKKTQVDIDFQVTEANDQLHCRLSYCSELFKKTTMEAFLSFFNTILSIVVDNKEIKIGDIHMPHQLSRTGKSIYQDDSEDFGF